MTRLINRLLFRKDDPLRELRVPRRDRLVNDIGPLSTASGPQTGNGAAIDFERDEVINRLRVESEEDLA